MATAQPSAVPRHSSHASPSAAACRSLPHTLLGLCRSCHSASSSCRRHHVPVTHTRARTRADVQIQHRAHNTHETHQEARTRTEGQSPMPHLPFHLLRALPPDTERTQSPAERSLCLGRHSLPRPASTLSSCLPSPAHWGWGLAQRSFPVPCGCGWPPVTRSPPPMKWLMTGRSSEFLEARNPREAENVP